MKNSSVTAQRGLEMATRARRGRIPRSRLMVQLKDRRRSCASGGEELNTKVGEARGFRKRSGKVWRAGERTAAEKSVG